jgi:hypothetical protein
MIAPSKPCNASCPGWKVARVGGVSVIVRCQPCWSQEVLAPTADYYLRQPECRAAMSRSCVFCSHAHEPGSRYCGPCADRILNEIQEAREDAIEQ